MKNVVYVLVFLMCSACTCTKPNRITILHTNDTHSQVEPKADDCGGYARRMGLIQREREFDRHLLLVDAGDFCQGTPYFNYYKGRIEVDAMNRMGYDAVALGNHEFDNGIDTLASILQNARFDVVCANYDMRGTALESIVKPYTIIRRNGLKIGIFGIGCDPKGIISDKNFHPITFSPPYPVAQQMADTLRSQNCDIVICLSHLGTFGKSPNDYNDSTMVATTRGIDVVVGGHTHQLHDTLRIANMDGFDIPVCQMGKSGANLGKIVLNIGDKSIK